MTEPTDPNDLLTIDDLMRILRVRRSKAFELAATMPTVALGRGVRVRRAAFEEWLLERERPPCRRA